MSRPRVLVVGPGPRSAGGVWAVMSTLLASPLADRFDLRHVATHRDGSGRDKLAAAAAGIARVAVVLARRRADLVWVHVSADFSFRRKTVVVALARLSRTPVVLHVHGSDVEVWYRAASRPERAMVRAVLRAADLVVALTPTWERRLRAMTPCVTTAIYNPVAVPAPSPAGARREGRIVCLGRLGERKGSRVLVRALARIAPAHPDAHLVLAGDGDHEGVAAEARAAGVADRVELRTWIAPAEVGRLLDSAAVFALPSREEGLPVALLEAMAHGVPSVVTPVGGIPDLVRDGEDGLIVRPDDPEGLATAIGRLLGEPDLAERIGAAGRGEVERRAAVPVVAAQVERAIDETLRRRFGTRRRRA